jgi:hypothetical protein
MASTISAGLTSGTAIALSGDTSGALVLQTNGTTTAVTIDTSQNVGIGTSSPATKVHALTPSATTVAYRAENSVSYAEFQVDSSGNSQLIAPGGVQIFNTNGAERMRIDSIGNLLVGQTTNPATSTMVIKVSTGSANGVNAQITSNTGTSYPWSNYNATATYVGGITCTSTGTAFPTSSDYRLKEDVQPMTGALTKVALLKPCTYKWKLNGSDGQGFIAHELAEFVPDAVIGEKDAVDAEGKPMHQGIDTSFLVATLTAAIQEQQALITQLQADVAALKGKV